MTRSATREPSGATPESSGAALDAPKFVHLHVHTEYSLLDGACRVKDLVAACKKMNMSAVAVTDHGNLFGAIEFYTAARAAGIKPIIGCEMYLAPGDRRDRTARGPGEGAYHLLLLAQNLAGYRNLIKLASIGYLEGFYYKPRIDKDVLREFSAGLLCTSTCLGGEIPQALTHEDRKQARVLAETYLDIFGPDRFFIELQDHGMSEQRMINPELVDLAKRLGLATIATNDVHYLTHDDVEAHDVLCCISTRRRVQEEDRFKFPTDQFYLKSPLEMLAALPEHRAALEHTLRVAEMCNVEFDLGQRYAPVFTPPAAKTADDYLRELVLAGARERYGGIGAELQERLDYELSVIASKGFSSYFLIVGDVVRFCRAEDIPVAARGSACSTVVGYCLRISGVDPLHYGLYFERFMDPERDEMPDIDIDLCQDRRQEVIEYVRRKYGHVAQIITFGRLKPKAAIRDVCRALDVPLAQADRIAKLVPEELKMTIDKALQQEPELRRLYDTDPQVRKVCDLSRRLEGLARHASVHAAGVVIADRPLDELVPLYKPSDSNDVTTQFEGTTVEKVGLLKMDFLGLKTLSQIHLTCTLIRKLHGVEVDLDNLDLTDPRVYQMLSRGDTRGVFQFESGGMRDVLLKMRPNRIYDLIAANALFRPGPMQYIDEYIARKHGKSWSTPHPLMTEVLQETYGIMVYQEQVSRLVNRLGDVPLRRAFRLAKAISKKKTDAIDAEREPFLQGAAAHGVSREVATQVFEDILQFGGYAFNKAHSTGYAVVAFQTAYLKAYYPAEFMAALLTYESGDTAKIGEYIDECRRVRQADGSVGIPVLPPDVNESDEAFTVVFSAALPGDGRQHAAANGAAGNGRTINGASGTRREPQASLTGPAAPGTQDRSETGPPTATGGESGSAGAGAAGAEVTGARSAGAESTNAGPRGAIRFGLAAISGLGHKAVSAILAARRDGGRFRDLYDFCGRVDLQAVNKSAIESLIKSGAFDNTGGMRRALFESVERAIDAGQESQRDRRAGQLDMFGVFQSVAPATPPTRSIGVQEWTDAEMLAHEKETLGFYVTKHPLTQYAELVERFSSTNTAGLRQLQERTPVLLGGLLSRLRSVLIRQGRSTGQKMFILTLEDFAGAIEAIVYPDTLGEVQPHLRPDAIVFVEGTVDRRKEEPSVRVSRVIPVEAARRLLARELVVRLRSTGSTSEALPALRDLFRHSRGSVPVFFEIATTNGCAATVRGRSAAAVEPSAELLAKLGALVGAENVLCGGVRGYVGGA